MPEKVMVITTGHLCAGKTVQLNVISDRLRDRTGTGLYTFDLAWIDRAASIDIPDSELFTYLNVLLQMAEAKTHDKAFDGSKLNEVLTKHGCSDTAKLKQEPDWSKVRRCMELLLPKWADVSFGFAECRYMRLRDRQHKLD